MRNSIKIACTILLTVAIIIYTIGGKAEEFTKTKVYDNPQILVSDYIKSIFELDNYERNRSRLDEDSSKVLGAYLSKVCETISERNALLAYESEPVYIDKSKINPIYYNSIYSLLDNKTYDRFTFNEAVKVEEENYTERLRAIISEYDKSFNYIEKYKKPSEIEVYKVDGEYVAIDDLKENYIIYFVVVNEGNGLVVDGMAVYNTTVY